MLRRVMMFLFAGFAAFRINIGLLRVQYNVTGNIWISQAHAFAFMWWGAAELIVLGMLLFFTKQYVSSNTSQNGNIVLGLFQSSVPRIGLIVLNSNLKRVFNA